LLIPLPACANMFWPTLDLMTISANTICSPSPHATVRQRIARRLVESRYATKIKMMSPSSPVNRAKFPPSAPCAVSWNRYVSLNECRVYRIAAERCQIFDQTVASSRRFEAGIS
jgi:hypothetical protein